MDGEKKETDNKQIDGNKINGKNDSISTNNKIKQIIQSCGEKLLSAKFLLTAGIGVSSGFIVEGLLCFTMCEVNMRSYILSVYYILFGLLSIGAELRFEIISKYLRILFSYSGRGLWYFFLGTIALGGEWWAILIALFLIALGCLNIMAGCKRGRNVENIDDYNNDNNNNNNNFRNRLESESAVNQQQKGEENEISNNDINVELGNNENSDKIDNDEKQNLNQSKNVNPFAEYEDYR